MARRTAMRPRALETSKLTLTVRKFTQWERTQMAAADLGEHDADNIVAMRRCGMEHKARRVYRDQPRRTVHRAGKRV